MNKELRYLDLLVSDPAPGQIRYIEPDTLELTDDETIIGISEHDGYSGTLESIKTHYVRVWIAKDAA